MERACYRGSYCSAGRCGVGGDRDQLAFRCRLALRDVTVEPRRRTGTAPSFTIYNTPGAAITARSVTITITPALQASLEAGIGIDMGATVSLARGILATKVFTITFVCRNMPEGQLQSLRTSGPMSYNGKNNDAGRQTTPSL